MTLVEDLIILDICNDMLVENPIIDHVVQQTYCRDLTDYLESFDTLTHLKNQNWTHLKFNS